MSVNYRMKFATYLSEEVYSPVNQELVAKGAVKSIPVGLYTTCLYNELRKCPFMKFMYNEKEVGVILYDDNLVKEQLGYKALVSLFQSNLYLSKKVAEDVCTALYSHYSPEFAKFTEIEVFRKPGDKHLAFKELAYVPNVTEADIPEFMEFKGRCDYGETLVLWLGSLLEPKSSRAQYLRLQGVGGDGKSTLINMIKNYFGEDSSKVTDSKAVFSTYNASILTGTRVLMFTDENNSSFTSSGVFKRLTGDDVYAVEEKFLPRREIKLNCKVIISANKGVTLTDCEADKRRFIGVKILNPIPVENRLVEVGDKFIHSSVKVMSYCYDYYRNFIKNNNLSVGSPLPYEDKNFEEAMQSTYEDTLDIFHSYFEVTDNPKDRVSLIDVRRKILGWDNFRKSSKNEDMIDVLHNRILSMGCKVVNSSNVKYYSNLKEKVK